MKVSEDGSVELENKEDIEAVGLSIKIVDDEPCPECGAYWGHPNPELNFPNRPKVDNHFKCYNPNCTVGFYDKGKVVERKSEEERKRDEKRVENAKIRFRGINL